MKRLALLLLILASLQLRADDPGPQLGLQSWTCRNMTFEQVVAFAGQHRIKYLELYSKHLDPLAPREESLRKKAVLAQHGLVCYTFGVTRTSRDPAANRRLFEFARLMDIKLIVVEPREPEEWDSLEALVREFDIKLAIHNHGRKSPYGDPAKVQAVLAVRDPRIGVCLDVGHLTESGFDAAQVFRDYHGRVYDIHLKDKKTVMQDGKTVVLDVENGTGDVNYAGLFAEVRREKWSGVMAIETDNPAFAADPGPLVDSATTFFHHYFP